ncbi:MAG: hypothetical protein IJA16_04945 [Clostridia bacterium]|nr:hypothetical protein [Clostridia bacterium]
MERIYKSVMEDSNTDIINLIKSMCKNPDMEISVDNAENVIIHKAGKGKKIMISAIIPKIRVYISKINDNKAEFELSGDIEKMALLDKEIFCNGEMIGIVRESRDKEKESKYFIEKIDDTELKIGDVCTIENKVKCKGDTLYGTGINSIIPLKITENLIIGTKYSVNDIYFILSFSENSAKTAVNMIKPDYIYSIYCAETKDVFERGKGCGVVYKDGNAVVADDVRSICEETAHKNDIKTQVYIGKQSPLPEIFGIIGKGAEVLGICIPTEKLKSACEVVGIEDMDCAVKLLSQIIAQ